MFLEHSNGVRRLGYSAGSASKVMLATQANEPKEAKRDRTVCKLTDKVCDLFASAVRSHSVCDRNVSIRNCYFQKQQILVAACNSMLSLSPVKSTSGILIALSVFVVVLELSESSLCSLRLV